MKLTYLWGRSVSQWAVLGSWRDRQDKHSKRLLAFTWWLTIICKPVWGDLMPFSGLLRIKTKQTTKHNPLHTQRYIELNLGVVAHEFKPSTGGQRQAELWEFEVSLGYILIFQDSQPELYSETLVSKRRTPPSSSKKTRRTRLRKRRERTLGENDKHPKDIFRRQAASNKYNLIYIKFITKNNLSTCL